MKQFLVILLGISLWGCFAYDPPAQTITIRNNTAFNIVVLISYSDTLNVSQIEKTFGKESVNSFKKITSSENYIKTNSNNDIGLLYWKMSNNYDNKIRIYIFKEEIVQDNNWEFIVANHLYEKISISLNKLKSERWHVIIPQL